MAAHEDPSSLSPSPRGQTRTSAEHSGPESDARRAGVAVLVGRTNVGKSTLVNTLVGAKVSIVTPKPQTTRYRVVGVINRDQAQLVLVDTPGVFQPRHSFDESLLRTVARSLPDCELCLFVVDASTPPRGEDGQAARLVQKSGLATVLLLNKRDLVPPDLLETRREEYSGLMPADGVFAVSALTGAGLEALRDHLFQRLPPGEPYYPPDATTDQVESLLVAERIRECVMLTVHQEVPYSVAVTVDQLEPRDNGVLYIGANLYVERESQKGILIGKGGRVLKAIGTSAREQLEPLFGRPVYLDLWVRVLPKWRKDPRALRRLGFLQSD